MKQFGSYSLKDWMSLISFKKFTQKINIIEDYDPSWSDKNDI